MNRSKRYTSKLIAGTLATLTAAVLLIGLSTLALAPVNQAFGQAFGHVSPSCESAQASFDEAKSWVARYQPLAARGGVYRKAFEQALVESTSAQANLQASCPR